MGAKKICDKYNKYGTVNDLVKCGRPRKTSMRIDRRIIRQVRFRDSSSHQKNLNLVHIHERTGRRRLNENGLKIYIITRKKLFINAKNQKKRLLFAKQYITKPLSFWEHIIWLDESIFELINKKKKKRI